MTIRVHELAKELKISTMALKKHLTDLGVNVKSHMSLVEDEVADKIRLKYKEQIDAEKRAERDRKRLIEMRQAAKAQKSAQEAETIKAEEPVPPVAEPVKEVPKKEEPKPVKEPEKETPIPVKEKPVEVKPEEKPHKPAPEKPKAVPKPKPEVIPPKTAAPAKPEPWKKQEPSAPSIKPIPTPPSVEIKKEEKKFGKAKISHEELGEKSKHKKAIISSTKKAKQKLIETIEIDEAEISRNIKKTLQKSSKRKKYHREAQYVEDRSNEIVIREFTSVSELAKIMNVSPSDIISKFFMMGQLVTMNQRLDRDLFEMICINLVDYRFEDEYGMDIIDKEREQYNNVKEEPCPPVVTIIICRSWEDLYFGLYPEHKCGCR